MLGAASGASHAPASGDEGLEVEYPSYTHTPIDSRLICAVNNEQAIYPALSGSETYINQRRSVYATIQLPFVLFHKCADIPAIPPGVEVPEAEAPCPAQLPAGAPKSAAVPFGPGTGAKPARPLGEALP